MKPQLTVEINSAFAKANDSWQAPNGNVVLVTPPLDENYWVARVKLYRRQAVVVFPKFGVLGCGFAQESDWNTNLPLSVPAERLFRHIQRNKRHAEIADADCIRAIELLQEALLTPAQIEQGKELEARAAKVFRKEGNSIQ